jgi:Na+/H+ antiporter NhaD/arsenite permease-like protein
MTQTAWIAVVLFLTVYAIIVSEKIHRTKIALVGAIGVLLLKIVTQEEAIHSIDFNTLGLLIGMMMIVAISRQTGIFQYLAVKAAKAVKGDPLKIMAVLFFLTALLSALLDNVTTVLLLTSIIFAITSILEINPIPFLIMEILASNIGGTATLIGDPPNIMIGSATGLGFSDFLINMGPPALIIAIVTTALLYVIYRKDLTVDPAKQQKIIEMDETKFLTDPVLLRKSLIVMGATVIGFVLHQALHFESATVALGGGAILLLVSGKDPEEVFHEVEWNTIFFFVGLFVLVGSLEHTGVIKLVAEWALNVTQGNIIMMNFLVLWLSAFASAFIDNIPFVATMIPLIKSMAEIGGIDVSVLWWTLALGACLGGNGTLIGASANVVVMSIAEAHGHPISFKGYMKIGLPMMVISIIIANLWIYLFYLR